MNTKIVNQHEAMGCETVYPAIYEYKLDNTHVVILVTDKYRSVLYDPKKVYLPSLPVFTRTEGAFISRESVGGWRRVDESITIEFNAK